MVGDSARRLCLAGQLLRPRIHTPNDRIASWEYGNALLRFDNEPGALSIEAFVKNIDDSDNITNSIIEDAQVGSYRNVRVLGLRTYGVAVPMAF